MQVESYDQSAFRLSTPKQTVFIDPFADSSRLLGSGVQLGYRASFSRCTAALPRSACFFRGLGGAIGAAVLGSVFIAVAGSAIPAGRVHALAGAARGDLIGGVQAVFIVASAIAALALLIVLALPELELRGTPGAAAPPTSGAKPPTPATATR